MPQTKVAKRRTALFLYEHALEDWVRALRTHPAPNSARGKVFGEIANSKVNKLRAHITNVSRKLQG